MKNKKPFALNLLLVLATTHSASSSIAPASISIPNFPNWPTLLEALQQLLPAEPSSTTSTFPTETLLKLYTIVFDYCVGTGVNQNGHEKVISGKNNGNEFYNFVLTQFSSHVR